MRTDAQRIAAYNARELSSLVDPTLSAVQTMATENFAAYATSFYAKQVQLRALLDGYGIPTSQYFGYEAFNGEMYHLSRVASGASAVITATALVAKYVSMFLVAANLKEIAEDLYSITVP
jgi:hypothetical protein